MADLRIRQICLLARDLGAVEADLRSVLGLDVAFRDPGVARFGLQNMLLPIGNDLLEVVSPIQPDTAGDRFLERRGGDGGYMVILQVPRAEYPSLKKRVADRKIRLVWDDAETGREIGGAIQLHPRDMPGAIVELRWNVGEEQPDGPWVPAGPDWQRARRTDIVSTLRAAEIQTDDPPALARQWGDVLDCPVDADGDGNPIVQLKGAVIRFVEVSDGRGEGLGGLDVEVRDGDRALQAAENRGCRVGDDSVMLCGVRFRLL